MAFKFGKAPSPAPTGETKIMPDSKETEKVIAQHARLNEAGQAAETTALSLPESAEVIDETPDRIDNESRKLTKLLADDFPFDESQLEAIDGIVNQRFSCLTGAAGTGKTTTTKAIVDRIQNEIGSVDMAKYFRKADDAVGDDSYQDADDDYEKTDKVVPSICLVGFTGRSSQMIKKNFPRDWHPNIMTIHRMLAFVPEWYEAFDPELNTYRNKMRFTPTYTKHFKLPWDVIVIDEAGMLSLDLWEQVWAACKEGCRIIMIGDINQLPPVHGRSIFGFAMTKWPSWELTHIHRQQGANNSIVDNAWQILKGYKPVSDNYQSDPGWKFAMMPVPEDSVLASQKIRKWLAAMNGKAYQPHRDTVITAINGEDTSRGYALGQIPMNRELAIVFNKENPRFVIDGGRERKQFAVGDKVMATKNDHEAGITNGMTGIITTIEANSEYAGDRHRFGMVEEVAKYLADIDEDDEEEFSLEDLADSHASVSEGLKAGKESKDRGPASHTVTVRFGMDEHAIEIPFRTLAEVGSLMTAYVVTCHKMQGGESPLVVVICHQAHKAMLNREWLYTAVTRASGKCVLFFTDLGLRAALSKQRITGKTLREKIKVFQELQTKGIAGSALMVDVPEPESYSTDITVAPTRTMAEIQAEKVETAPSESRPNPFAEQLRAKIKPEVRERIIVVERTEHHHHYHESKANTDARDTVDKGYVRKADMKLPTPAERVQEALKQLAAPAPRSTPYQEKLAGDLQQLMNMGVARETRSTLGAVLAMRRNEDAMAVRLLTHQPHLEPSVPQVKKPFKFGVK